MSIRDRMAALNQGGGIKLAGLFGGISQFYAILVLLNRSPLCGASHSHASVEIIELLLTALRRRSSAT